MLDVYVGLGATIRDLDRKNKSLIFFSCAYAHTHIHTHIHNSHILIKHFQFLVYEISSEKKIKKRLNIINDM